MKSVALIAFPRTTGRRAGSKKLRASGRVPAVIYGRQIKPQNLEIQIKDFKDMIHGANSEIVLLDLSIQGDPKPKRLALVQDVQHHVLSRSVLHVDLHEVAEDEKVTLMVPVEAVGEASGVKTGGGVLEHVLFKLKLRGLPKDLPETVLVDVSALAIGQAIHLGDIKPPAGVEILGDKHISVLAVAAPLSEAQEAADAAAAPGAAEVEMLKEKKEEGAEGAPAGEKGKTGEKAAAGKGGEKAPAAGDKAGEKKSGDKKAAEKKPADKKK